ncbi:GlxA family transcriptional regulator [Spirochaeta cellobiosiphila]|uniref:GlxA family transcriptional regulator n=1 Tax=Spirochaeta cellobiosiphila TaxID=504483 RepID=UPI0004165A9B|nr:helix-turn-helix domain-containing protein [Spirochaeta cellobiosiphila]
MNKNRSHSILLLLNTQGLLFEGAGILDIFHQANHYSGQELYKITIMGTEPEPLVHGRAGYQILADTTIEEWDLKENQFDTLIVTGSGRQEIFRSEIIDWIKNSRKYFKRIVSVCSGAILLAEAGLLKGKKATTHWQLLDQLAQYPEVTVKDDPIYVKDGSIWTSAGASSGFDITLAIVEEDYGFELAKKVAQYLVLYLRRPGGQSQFSTLLTHQVNMDSPIKKAQDYIQDHLGQSLKVEDIADIVHMSPRHFARAFKKEVGLPPGQYIEKLRLDRAKVQLEQSTDTVDIIASDCGFETPLSLRRLFDKYLKITPKEYRNRFGRI